MQKVATKKYEILHGQFEIEDNILSRKGEEKIMFLSGNDACAEGALYAGISFYAGYPITPSTEIAEYLSRHLPEHGKTFIQMEDEIASMAAIIGASLGGAKSMTATSGPGFSLMQENIGFASIAEVPCVIANVQRLGPSTGGPTSPSQQDVMQARWGRHGDQRIIALSPSSIQETFDLTVRAFNLSEKYRTPVILLMDEVVGHMREKLIVPPAGKLEVINREKPSCNPEDYLPFGDGKNNCAPLAVFGEGYRFHVTGLHHDERGFPTLKKNEIISWFERTNRKFDDHLDDIIMYDEYDISGADTVIITFGITARSALAAQRIAKQEGKNIGVLKLKTIWPFPEKIVSKIADSAKTIIVPEMNMGQLVLEVERVVKGRAEIKKVNRFDGEMINPYEILEVLGHRS